MEYQRVLQLARLSAGRSRLRAAKGRTFSEAAAVAEMKKARISRLLHLRTLLYFLSEALSGSSLAFRLYRGSLGDVGRSTMVIHESANARQFTLERA